MAVTYTKEQEELLRKLRGDGGNADAFPENYNPVPSLRSQSPVFKPQPPSNPPLQNLLGTNPAAALADPYRAALYQPRTIGAPPAPAAPPATPTYTSSDSPNFLQRMVRPIVNTVSGLVPEAYKTPVGGGEPERRLDPGFLTEPLSRVAGFVDRLVPPATTPPPASTTAAPPAAQPRVPDAAGNYNFDVRTTGDGVSFSNDISSGQITGLTQEQRDRVAAGLRTANRGRGVVPASFFTGGGAAQGGQIPGFDDDSIARLTRAANERVDIGNMRPADAATALSERNYARQQLQQIRAAMAGGASAQQQANAEVQKAIAVEQIRRSAPEWKSSDIEVVDTKSPTGTRKVQVMSAPDGRTYQVPDAQDIATLAAAPNDEERIRLLRMSGVPDEHIPTYLARFR